MNLSCFRPRRRARRGMAIIVVLGLISIAMALSYTMMRTQGTTLKIQENSRRRADARQAALSGLMAAMGHLHQANWTGVDSTLAGKTSPYESYTVLYTTGDSRLTPSSPDYADWPYRLTLEVTGYATSQEGGAASTHKLRAVTRFVPKGLSAAPPDWSHMQQFTVYQWDDDKFSLDVPARIEGPVWMQGKLDLSHAYPSTSSGRRRYLSDLNAMRGAGRPDYRPFGGTVHWQNNQSSTEVDLVTQALGVTTQTASQKTASNWQHPGPVESYRLYPGGESYNIPRLAQTLENVALAPDPKTNPLGVFLREGSVELRNGVSVMGQIIATEDVFIYGNGVTITAPDLPTTQSTGEPVRLPAVIVGDDFRVFSGAVGIIRGPVLAWDETDIREGAEATQFELRGRLITKQFTVGPRTEWDYGVSSWTTIYSLFVWQLNNAQQPVLYFPDFVSLLGRKPAPKILFAPDATPHVGHFPQTGQAVYAPGAGDAGLRFELLDFQDEG